MGRVYEALIRAGAADSTARADQPKNSVAGGEIRTARIVPSGTEIENSYSMCLRSLPDRNDCEHFSVHCAHCECS